MPSVIGTAANNYAAGTSTALNVAHDSGAAGNGRKCLIAGVFIFDAGGDDITAITYNGQALTLFASVGTSIATTGVVRLYRLLDASLADGSNTFSITRGAVQDELAYWVQTFDDVNQTTPLSGAQSASGNGNTATIPTITLPGGSDISVGVLAAFDAAGYTTTTSDTSIGSVDGTASASGYAMQRGNADLSWTLTNTPDYLVIGGALIHDAGAAVPTVSNVSPSEFEGGQVGVTITGTNFEASQGTGNVIISPSDNVADGSAVSQTETAWGDTSITITTARGSLTYGAQMYLFVTNNSAASNATGYPVMFKIQPPVAWFSA